MNVHLCVPKHNYGIIALHEVPWSEVRYKSVMPEDVNVYSAFYGHFQSDRLFVIVRKTKEGKQESQ